MSDEKKGDLQQKPGLGAKKTPQEIRRAIEKNLEEAKIRLAEKKEELKAILDETKHEQLVAKAMKNISPEEQVKQDKKLKEMAGKLKLARKSLEGWWGHYRNTLVMTEKSKEALLKSEKWKAIASHEDATTSDAVHQSIGGQALPKPSSASIPADMRRKAKEPVRLKDDDDKSPSKQ